MKTLLLTLLLSASAFASVDERYGAANNFMAPAVNILELEDKVQITLGSAVLFYFEPRRFQAPIDMQAILDEGFDLPNANALVIEVDKKDCHFKPIDFVIWPGDPATLKKVTLTECHAKSSAVVTRAADQGFFGDLRAVGEKTVELKRFKFNLRKLDIHSARATTQDLRAEVSFTIPLDKEYYIDLMKSSLAPKQEF